MAAVMTIISGFFMSLATFFVVMNMIPALFVAMFMSFAMSGTNKMKTDALKINSNAASEIKLSFISRKKYLHVFFTHIHLLQFYTISASLKHTNLLYHTKVSNAMEIRKTLFFCSARKRGVTCFPHCPLLFLPVLKKCRNNI